MTKFDFTNSYKPAHRSAMLDCIRAIAILAVLAFHVATRYDTTSLDVVAGFFQRVGFLGVDIFFPLSGYLISRYLLESNKADFVKVFFLRRAFRILPLYFLALLTYYLANQLVGREGVALDRLWINALFLTGWYAFFEGKDSVVYLITWSLSVEEFGYILLGVMAFIARRDLVVFLVILCIAPTFLRYGVMLQDPSRDTFQALYYLPLARLDSIALGGLTACLLIRESRVLLAGLVILALAMIGLMSFDPLLYRTFLFLFVAVISCIFIVLAETTLKGQNGPIARIFAAIGFYSYFNYLFQFFVIDAFMMFLRKVSVVPPNFWITFLITLVVTQALAMLSYRIYEGPLMIFGRRQE